MKKTSRIFLTLGLLTVLAALGLTACQKADTPPTTPDEATNAAPAKAPDHPEHPKQ